MNNYPFMLARTMKNMGYDVTFIISYPQENKLCRPEYRYEDIQYPYPSWIKEVTSSFTAIQSLFPSIYQKDAISILNKSDIVILNDRGHSLRPYLRKEILSISLLTGSDIEVLANYKTIYYKKKYSTIKNIKIFILNIKNIFYQRKGIAQAYAVNYFAEGIHPEGDTILEQIRDKNKIRFNFMMSEIEAIEYSEQPDNDVLRIFNATRFVWSEPFPDGINSWENKRNDIMLKGIAKFYKKTGISLDIHFVEKGHSVNETKELLKELGISHLVTWHETMTQKEVIEQYKKCNILFEQFGSDVIGMAGLDAMASGRIVIANARPEIFEPIIKEKTPVCHATDENEVSYWLEKLVNDKDLRAQISIDSRKYVEKHFSTENAVKKIMASLNNND